MIAWHIQRPAVTGGARTQDDNALCSQLCKASRQTVCGRTRSTRTCNPWRSSTRFSSLVDRPLCKYADDLSQMHANFRERSRDTHQQQGHSRQPLGTSRVQTQFRRTGHRDTTEEAETHKKLHHLLSPRGAKPRCIFEACSPCVAQLAQRPRSFSRACPLAPSAQCARCFGGAGCRRARRS